MRIQFLFSSLFLVYFLHFLSKPNKNKNQNKNKNKNKNKKQKTKNKKQKTKNKKQKTKNKKQKTKKQKTKNKKQKTKNRNLEEWKVSTLPLSLPSNPKTTTNFNPSPPTSKSSYNASITHKSYYLLFWGNIFFLLLGWGK